MTVELGPTLFSARPLAEYPAMFALSEADLSGQVLDCPGGAASFTAEVCAAGGHAVAVDVIYEPTPAELAVIAREETDRGNAYMAGNADRYVWSYFPDVASHTPATTRRTRPPPRADVSHEHAGPYDILQPRARLLERELDAAQRLARLLSDVVSPDRAAALRCCCRAGDRHPLAGAHRP